MADHWYNSYAKIKVFGKILYQADVISDQDDIFEYFDKPSTYDSAYDLWQSMGSPEPGDKEWDKFVDSIEVEVIEEEEEEDDN